MKISHVVAFIFGAFTGAAVAWHYRKAKYEERMNEELESIREIRNKNVSKNEDNNTNDSIKAKVKEDIMSYAKKLNDEGYTNYSSIKKIEETDEEENKVIQNRITSDSTEKPYVISPDEFNEFDDYSVISLTYYADGKLADDNDELVEDVDDVVGINSLEHFGEYDDDCVYVRNDRLKVDYEILRSLRKYSEILEQKPYLKEV